MSNAPADTAVAPVRPVLSRASTPAVNRAIIVRKSKLEGLLSFGDDNLFAQQLTEIVNTSVTAAACYDAKAKFIEGNGFNDDTLADRVIHRSGLTLDDVLSHTARNVAMGEVVAVHVAYNALGQKVGLRPLDYEMVRLGMPDEHTNEITYAGICNYLNSQLFKNKAKTFTKLPLFNDDPQVVKEQIAQWGGINNYPGQLFYAYLKGNNDDYYHTPSYFCCVKDMESEAELSLFDYSSIVNGFSSAGVFAFLGGSEEPDYDPLQDEKSIEYQIQKQLGAESAGNITVYRAKNEAELKSMKFESFYGPTISERYLTTNKRVETRIARGWGVPPILANIQREGGVMFSADELAIASRYMQWNVNKPQRLIKRSFEKLLSNWKGSGEAPDCTVENLDYFNLEQPQQQAG